MRKSMMLGTVAALALSSATHAEVPAVVADIPPVHSLVAMVMQGLGTPDLLVQPGASPHGYSLRPSEARALDQAQAVFWIGEDLTPWLGTALEALAGDASVTALIEAPGTTRLELRKGATFDAHDHDDHGDHDHGDHDEHEDHEEHAADSHDHDHDHEDHAQEDAHDDHAHGEDDAHRDDHDDHGHDPHAWLDPENARAWLDVLASELSRLDPENAGTYRANADQAKDRLATLTAEISAQMAPLRGMNFVVFHDAYQYFENRFQIPAAGSISISDATDPSPARIKEIRDKVQDLSVVCAFSEPQFNPGLLRTVFQGVDARTGVMDPQGVGLTAGPDLYPTLIANLANSLSECLN